MDNCGGQNKNNCVILLAPYLVEMDYFDRVNMLFLVVGHTKNVYNWRFNNLKNIYHHSQVFSFDDAVECLSKSKYVTVWKVNAHEDWRDYFHMLQKAYNILSKCGLKFNVNHIFTAFLTRLSDLLEHQRVFGDVRNQDFVPQGGDRFGAICSLQIENVFYKGLPGYKQVLMHEKYLPFVPHQYHSDDLFKKPSEEVLKSEKEDQDQRRKYNKMRRNDSKLHPYNHE
jgi:hypothetical protein